MSTSKRKRKGDDEFQVEVIRGRKISGITHINKTSTARIVTLEDEGEGRLGTRQEIHQRVVEVPIHASATHQHALGEADNDVSASDGMPPLVEDDLLDDDDDDGRGPSTSFETNASTEQEADPMEKKRQRVKHLFEFLPFRQSYLEEILRLDGRGYSVSDDRCVVCHKQDQLFRCHDCTGECQLCRACVVDVHKHNPLHKISTWNGSFWDRATLLELGLVVHLGHGGSRCPVAEELTSPIVVVHTNGVHNVRVTHCKCGDILHDARELRNQLVRIRWFPATQDRPGTAFTFAVLDSFHELSVQGKISAHDFYHGTVHLTDNAGLIEIHKRYDEFLRVSRYYRHLILLKRAGRGHDPSGVDATQKGELALDCPSCPLPGKNIPSNWMNAPRAILWLYMLVLAIDANFRLKRKERGVKSDPELGGGWGQFVEGEMYESELGKDHGHIEPNNCQSSFQAIERATMKAKDGYAVTGVGAVICARSGILRPNGVGDLQRGERYANMDFIFLSSIMGALATWILISYDISCQWSRHLESRVETFPKTLQRSFREVRDWIFAIPKFHLPAHGDSCQSVYSLNYLRYTARTDGEGIERGWSHINPIATSTREMGPGFRHDTLDAHWSALNWRKITGMGTSLLKKHTEAVKYSKSQREVFDEVNASFPDNVTTEWASILDRWLDNPAGAEIDPFMEPMSSKTVADVRKELAMEEGKNLRNGSPSLHDTSASSMLLRGIELEEGQRALESLIKTSKSQPGTVETAVIEERKTALARKIKRWRIVQSVYMPVVALSVVDEDASESFTQPIRLPSSLSPQDRSTLSNSHDLTAKEKRIREAQAEDSLMVIKRILLLRKKVYGYKVTNLAGQRDGTRARVLMSSLNDKLDFAVARYRTARTALDTLDPSGAWQTRLLDLRDEHLVAPDGDQDVPPSAASSSSTQVPSTTRQRQDPRTASLGQGRKETSWLWRMRYLGDRDPSPGEVDIGLRAEWSKARARADHWDEELMLVREEMRRVLQYASYRSNWWITQMSRRQDLSTDVSDGLQAYAVKQAHLWESLGMKFARMWYPKLVDSGSPIDSWPTEFQVVALHRVQEPSPPNIN